MLPLIQMFMQKLMKVMTEGQKEGARLFFVAGDLNIELGFLCMDQDDEMKDMYGPQCWYGLEADP